MSKLYNVLFVCTGNSARSILAEALLNTMAPTRFRAFSAGSQPKGVVHPLTLQVLTDHHIPTTGLRSKSWEEFANADAPHLDFVFTVCDQAGGEVCPVWPGQPMTAHWGMPDPAAAEPARAEQAFKDALITLQRRLQLMLALPLHSLESLAIQQEIRAIGTR